MLVSLPCAYALSKDKVLLRANAGVTYDSNVFRVSNQLTPAQVSALTGGQGKSDFIWGIGGGIGLDLPVSRQRFRVDASVTEYYYTKFDQLDYTGYDLRGTWDWRLGNDWYGKVSAGALQTRQSTSSATVAAIPRLQRIYDGLLDARYALTPRWELQTSASASRTDYTAQVFQFDDFNYWWGTIGAQYRSLQGNSTGARLRYEQGKWPNRPPAPAASFDNEYTQYTLSALLDWRVTGRSRLYGDVGYTFRNRDSVSGEDFDGPSGRLTYAYSLTGKSVLTASIYEIRGPVEDNTTTYTKTTGIDLTYTHQISAKIELRAGASYYQQDYLGTSQVPTVTQRRDKLNVVSIGALWQATRTLSFSARAQYNDRTSNVPFSDYDEYIIYVSGGVQF